MFNFTISDHIKESFKEGLRVFVLFVFSSVISFLITNVPGISNFLGSIWADFCNYWNVCTVYGYTLDSGTIALGLTFLLRGLDKYLHELGKSKNDKTMIKGLTQF